MKLQFASKESNKKGLVLSIIFIVLAIIGLIPLVDNNIPRWVLTIILSLGVFFFVIFMDNLFGHMKAEFKKKEKLKL